ncbi:complement factor I [Pseudorasbora parva]|uniref:complement factor I n=1 Tax=Pseudorasbora parva TaxID=51549 RepID=UPI00351F6F60
MKVLAVFIFSCLLFQTATLESKPGTAGTQQRQPVTRPEQNPSVDLGKTTDLTKPPPKADTDRPSESSLKDNPPPNAEIDTPSESSLKDNPPPKAETETPSESNLKDNLPSKGETNTNSTSGEESFLGPAQCLEQKYTRLSCSKVFCPPWRRCIGGQCVCKMPYKCPRQEYRACTLQGSEYYSMCQAKAISCRSNTPIFSHISTTCEAKDLVEVSLLDSGSDKVVKIKTENGTMLVCGKAWNIAAANVVCRNLLNVAKGAERASKVKYKSHSDWPTECMRIRCTGSELSLAECAISKPQKLDDNDEVASATCYKEPKGPCKFNCANGKCLIHGKPCNGIDDCGDNSDEMCCQRCDETKAFLCKSGVCIPRQAVRDGIRDCLGGEDELYENGKLVVKNKTSDLIFDPMSEIRSIRSSAESQLQCGIPNLEYKQEDDATSHSRRKRLVGGEEALPTQIQWQVAIQEEGSIHCGGVYLGGCWVLTAAHCVRPKPKSYRIKFSLWMKHRKQSTTDSIPVKNIIIHHEYNPQTYVNDIALVQLEKLKLSDICMKENPAVRAVCVPWSTQQFQPNDTCTISGWGRDRAGKSAAILKWANVTIIGDCKNYYNDRFLPGMECAGDLEGKVDSCQGDSGGPLVCKDASGLSYVWGIVSWGDKCGEPNYPGVYTKVAHYFDWIRFHTGWPAVTKFNQ